MNGRPLIRKIILLCLLYGAAALLALGVGSSAMSMEAFFGGLAGQEGYATEALILYHIRLPRMLGALLAGGGLALSGLLLQKITANDLAGPNIIGVNAGAGFGAVLMLFFAPLWVRWLPLAAFCGAFLTTLLILWIAGRIDQSKVTVVLAGVAFSALLNAGISLFSLLDTDVLASYNAFSVGGLAGVTLKELALPALLIGGCFGSALLLAPSIDCLSLGDRTAASLGVRVRLLRTLCLMMASASAAAAVSFAGLLGFIGLVVPHMVRRLFAGHFRLQLVGSLLLGGILLNLADLLGRVLFAPSELPAGLVTALLGAPFFFYLLIRRKQYAEVG